MTEVEPWYKRVQGPFPLKYGCVGVKEDGGGSMRGRGLVGPMKVHRAVFRRDEREREVGGERESGFEVFCSLSSFARSTIFEKNARKC